MTANPGQSLKVLAVAAHPDDAEIGAGAILAGLAARGMPVGVLDLTRGELASNGTPEMRAEEAARAAGELGLTWRGNAGLPEWPWTEGSGVEALVKVLRACRPDVVLAPYPGDPHPGHVWAGRLAAEARQLAGMRRWRDDLGHPHRPRRLLHYFVNGETVPSLIVDASREYPRKRAALAAHVSQFQATPGSVPTRLNSGDLLRLIESRDRHFGAMIGVEFGEGLWSPEPIAVTDGSLLAERGGDGA
ncbi:MAG TPA: bacillithiol biosynthesis deacetylase BshB1 [Clostridiales bacterium]|nr:bacillithiol biosynthesis deacetylase BshB1 [Clostridiales bacterium]